MSGLEKIKSTLAGEVMPGTPIMLHNFMSAAREAGITMREYRESPKAIARAHIGAARKYGLDGILVDIDTCIEADAVGVPVDYPENEPARVIGPASNNIDILIEKMEPSRLLQSDRVKILLESVHLIKKETGKEFYVRGNCDQMAFSLAMLAYGMEDFMADLLDEEQEDKIFQLIDRAYEVHLKLHYLMQEAGADMTSFGDSSCGPDLISRELYLKFAHPYHVKLKEALAHTGVPVLCHICGKLDAILEDVADVGFAAVEVDYKTDIKSAAHKLNGKSVMFGPIDPSGIFFFGTKEQMEQETKRILDIFKGQGLVIGAGCALPAGTQEENIRTFVETVRKHRY